MTARHTPRARLVAIALALGACRTQPAPTPGSVEDLALYLRDLTRGDPAARTRELAALRLDRAAWDRTIVEPFRALYDRYAAGFDPGALDHALAAGGAIATRRHFAGDPKLTAGQAMLRWVVPVMYPSAVAELAGAPLDTVFVHDGVRWRALVGLDGLIRRAVERLDTTGCSATLALVHRSERCASAWFVATDAALRIDRARFDRMCRLATTLCDMRSP